MDISVKKLSEILKIDPQVLLDKMIAAGLSQTSIEDLVSNEDKQKLLSFIRGFKDSPVDDKPKAIIPTPQAPKKALKTDKTKKLKDSSKQKTEYMNDAVAIMRCLNVHLWNVQKRSTLAEHRTVGPSSYRI